MPLLRQWRVCCITTMLGLVISSAIVFIITPLYKADVQIVLPLSSTGDPSDRRANQAQQADPFVVRSFSEIIEDNGICQRVIDSLGLAKSAEFAPRATWIDQVKTYLAEHIPFMAPDTGSSEFSPAEIRADALLQDYKGRLKVADNGRSLVLGLSFQAQDARLARESVNAHARFFVEAEVNHYREAAETKSRWMKSEVARMATDMRTAQLALQVGPRDALSAQDQSGAGVAALRMRESIAKTTLDVYATVMKHYQELLADETYRGSDVRIVSAATLPTHPFFPKKILVIPVAGLVSLFLGIGAAGVASALRSRVGAEGQIRELGLPILGTSACTRLDPRAARVARVSSAQALLLGTDPRTPLHNQDHDPSSSNHHGYFGTAVGR